MPWIIMTQLIFLEFENTHPVDFVLQLTIDT